MAILSVPFNDNTLIDCFPFELSAGKSLTTPDIDDQQLKTWQITMQIKKDRVGSKHSNNTSSIIKWMFRYGHRVY